jgi:hypothetical protein
MEDGQATAKWANRVLRPLTSICRRIAKHKETQSMIATESEPQETAEGSDVPTLETDHKQGQQNCSGSDADRKRPSLDSREKARATSTQTQVFVQSRGDWRQKTQQAINTQPGSPTYPTWCD